MRKTFILDTSVLLYDAQAIHSFPGNDIVLPVSYTQLTLPTTPYV